MNFNFKKKSNKESVSVLAPYWLKLSIISMQITSS